MDRGRIMSELEYASAIARQGADAPLVGGRIGLLWGVLLALTFGGQWAILSGVFDVPLNTLGLVWLAFAVVGGIGTFVLDRSLRNKPGLSSVGNRLDGTIWFFFSMTMLACFLGLTANMFYRGTDFPLFDIIVAIGFAGQGMAYGTLSKITSQRWLLVPAIGAFLLAVVSFVLLQTTALYLVAAAGVILTVVLPALVQMRNEPAGVS